MSNTGYVSFSLSKSETSQHAYKCVGESLDSFSLKLFVNNLDYVTAYFELI